MARFLSSANFNGSNTLPCFDTNCYDPFLLPPPPDPDPDFSIPIDVHHPNRLLPHFLIAAASLLALSFLLLLLFYFLLRLRRRRLRSLGPHPHPPAPPPPLNPNDDLFDDDVPHHVWLIRTIGLDESIIKAIPSMVYKSGINGDCSVCLGEFADGELVKLLPKCSHVFHVGCIDTWLRSHVNCPLCRAPVVTDLAGISEFETGEEDQEACLDTVDLSNLTAGSSSSSSRGEFENVNGNDLQPVRRSVSMDASSLGMIMLRAELDPEVGNLESGSGEVELKGVGVCKSTEVKEGDDNLGKLGSELKRSMSSRSGRLFFPRYGRGRGASVLPL